MGTKAEGLDLLLLVLGLSLLHVSLGRSLRLGLHIGRLLVLLDLRLERIKSDVVREGDAHQLGTALEHVQFGRLLSLILGGSTALIIGTRGGSHFFCSLLLGCLSGLFSRFGLGGGDILAHVLEQFVSHNWIFLWLIMKKGRIMFLPFSGSLSTRY